MCRLCDEKFANEHQLIKHFTASHAPAKAYACTKCGRQFGWSSGKYAHERLCIGVDAPRRRPSLPTASINCRLCAHACDDQIDLRLHFRAAHAADERAIACANACGASFWELRKARAHEQKCTGRPSPRRCSIGGVDLKCVDCSRADFTLTAGVRIGFWRNIYLSSMFFRPPPPKFFDFSLLHWSTDAYIMHCVDAHQRAKPFHCSTCDQSFVQRHSLRAHQRKQCRGGDVKVERTDAGENTGCVAVDLPDVQMVGFRCDCGDNFDEHTPRDQLMAHLRQKHFRRMDIKSEPTIEEPMDTL
jgi:hypothetical protein